MSAPHAQARAEEEEEAEEQAQSGLGHDEIPVGVAPWTNLQLNEERLLQHTIAASLRPGRPSTGGKVFSVSVPPC